LHQVVVRGRAGGLQHEDVFPADVLEDLDIDLAVGEACDGGAAQLELEVLRDLGRQFRVGVAREDHQTFRTHDVGVTTVTVKHGRLEVFKRWLGRKDSNPRMPESKSGALTNLATPQHSDRGWHSPA